jgi:hypothetical protein
VQGQLKILLETITSRIVELENAKGRDPIEERRRAEVLKLNKGLHEDIIFKIRSEAYHKSFGIKDTPGIPNLTQ